MNIDTFDNLFIDLDSGKKINNNTLLAYSNKKSILIRRLIDNKFNDSIKFLDNFLFNQKLEINIFLDKKVGFIETFLLKILNLDYGNNGNNIEINIYNGLNKFNYIKHWIVTKLKNTRINRARLKFINFDEMDNNLYSQSIKLREYSFDKFKNSENHYYFIIDNLHFIDEEDTFKNLLLQNKDLIVPLLIKPDKLFSNIWYDISEAGYYKRCNEYFDILNCKKNYLVTVPYFYGTALINKNLFTNYKHNKLYINNKWENEDMDMALCNNLRNENISMYLISNKQYGRIIDNSNAINYWRKKNIDLYLIEDSFIDWEQKYIHESLYNDITKIEYKQPIQDLFNFQFFKRKFCEELIEEAEIYGNWSSGIKKDKRLAGGIENVPTRDIHLNQLELDLQWNKILFTYISKIASHLYSNYTTKSTNIVFIVRYTLDTQKFLEPHHDSSSYTVLFTLNDKFTGGGTHFLRQNYVSKNLPIGSCSIHPGKLTHYHSGLEIKSGKRYILVGFIN